MLVICSVFGKKRNVYTEMEVVAFYNDVSSSVGLASFLKILEALWASFF